MAECWWLLSFKSRWTLIFGQWINLSVAVTSAVKCGYQLQRSLSADAGTGISFPPDTHLFSFFLLFTMEEQYWFMQSRSVLWSTATAVGIFWECPAEVMSPQTLEFDSVHGKWVLHTSSVLSFAFIIWIFLVLLKSSIFGQVLIIHLTYNLIIYLRYFLEFFWGFLGYMLCVTAFFVCINIFSHSYC